jgi:hypothetical protein
MKKTLKILGAALAVLAAVVLVVSLFFLGPVVRRTVTTLGPSILGVPVSLDRVGVYPLRGVVRLSGLKIGNPKGFKSPQLFALSALSIDMQPSTLFTDTVVVDEVAIRGLEITYETTGLRSNVGRLLEQLESRKGEPAEAPAGNEAAPPAKPGKRTVIRRVVVEDLNVTVAATLAGGRGITLPLSKIELTDLGARGGGISVAEATVEVVQAIAAGVTKALAQQGVKLAGAGVDLTVEAGKLGGKSVIGAAELGADAARAAGRQAGKLLGGLKDSILGGTNQAERGAEPGGP